MSVSHTGTVERTSNANCCAKPSKNVGDWERMGSIASGVAIAVSGLRSGSPRGLLLMAIGGGLIYRGITGHCTAYSALGIHTNEPQSPGAVIPNAQGIRVTHSLTIQHPASKLYEFWRDFENLPQFMSHVHSVEILDSDTSKWIVDSGLGVVEWTADIILDVPNENISWKSREGSHVACAGSIHFHELPHLGATQVTLNLRYDAFGARAGTFLASLFGHSPEQLIREDLRRFKQLMETGEIPTTKGQPVGGCGRSKPR